MRWYRAASGWATAIRVGKFHPTSQAISTVDRRKKCSLLMSALKGARRNIVSTPGIPMLPSTSAASKSSSPSETAESCAASTASAKAASLELHPTGYCITYGGSNSGPQNVFVQEFRVCPPSAVLSGTGRASAQP